MECKSCFWHYSTFSVPTCFTVAHARFGLPGYDIWVASSGSVIVGDSVPSDVVEAIRMEHAIPRWGMELTTNTLPPEAGPHMLQAISYTKGCYVGQETIARLKSVGHVNRTLVLLQSNLDFISSCGNQVDAGRKRSWRGYKCREFTAS